MAKRPCASFRSGGDAGRGPIRGRGILEALERAGITLALRGDRLLVMASGGRIRPDARQVIELAERLLIGWLRSDPVACELDHGKEPAAEARSEFETLRQYAETEQRIKPGMTDLRGV